MGARTDVMTPQERFEIIKKKKEMSSKEKELQDEKLSLEKEKGEIGFLWAEMEEMLAKLDADREIVERERARLGLSSISSHLQIRANDFSDLKDKLVETLSDRTQTFDGLLPSTPSDQNTIPLTQNGDGLGRRDGSPT